MKCELCSVREASIVIQEKRADGTKEYHICLECARSRGLAAINPQAAQVLASLISGNALDESKIHLSGPLNGPALSSTVKNQRITRIPLTESICPACGTKFMDAKKTSSIGCIHCWETWGPLLYSKKRSARYRGKCPSNIRADEGRAQSIEVLEGELEKALANEDYEKAASFRDKIRLLKGSGGNS